MGKSSKTPVNPGWWKMSIGEWVYCTGQEIYYNSGNWFVETGERLWIVLNSYVNLYVLYTTLVISFPIDINKGEETCDVNVIPVVIEKDVDEMWLGHKYLIFTWYIEGVTR